MATSLTQPLDTVPTEAILIQYLRILQNADNLPFCKVNKFFSIPLVPRLYKIYWIMWMLACLLHKIVWNRWLIQQLEITIALVHIVLAFLASVQQGRALERAFIVLNSTSADCHTYRKYIGSLPSRDTSKIRHPQKPWYLYRLWCMQLYKCHQSQVESILFKSGLLSSVYNWCCTHSLIQFTWTKIGFHLGYYSWNNF